MEFKSQDKIPLRNLINNRLKELGWNQKELSKRTGVSEASISRFVNGSKGMKLESIYSILETTGLLRINSSRDIADKTWTFLAKAKTKYPDLRHIVAHANEAVKTNDTSLLRSTLIGVAERLKNIEDQQTKGKKIANG